MKIIEEVITNIYRVISDQTTADRVLKKDEYYFGDETENINGPYSSKEECIEAFKEYCRTLE